MPGRWKGRAPLLGIVFAALLVGSIALAWNTPNSDATGAKVLSYYQAHKSDVTASGILGALAAVFWLFFAGSLRDFLRRSGASDGLAATAFGGAILFAAGGALFSSLNFALGDVPSHLDPAAAQALNVLGNDLFFPIAAGGAVFALATGIAIVRAAVLPVWLGWVAIVIGVVSCSPAGFLAFFALLIWTVIASVLVSARARRIEHTTVGVASETRVGAAAG